MAASLALVLAASCASTPVSSRFPAGIDSDTPPPTRFAAVTTDGVIVVAETTTGRIVRRVVEGIQGSVRSLAVTPDRTTLYYTVNPADGPCGTVHSVPLDGGRSRPLANGSTVSISPDGRRLAWVVPFGCDEAGDSVTIQDLTTGRSMTWTIDEEIPEVSAVIDWDASSTAVILLLTGADTQGPLLFDPDSHGHPLAGDHVSAEIDGKLFSWIGTVRRGTNLVASVDYGDVGGNERYPMVEVDPNRDEIVGQLESDGRGLEPLDFDESGRHMLVLSEKGLQRWHNGTRRDVGAMFGLARWIE